MYHNRMANNENRHISPKHRDPSHPERCTIMVAIVPFVQTLPLRHEIGVGGVGIEMFEVCSSLKESNSVAILAYTYSTNE